MLPTEEDGYNITGLDQRITTRINEATVRDAHGPYIIQLNAGATDICDEGYTHTGEIKATCPGPYQTYNIISGCKVNHSIIPPPPRDVDCDEDTASTSTCTFIGEELYTRTTAAAGSGEACTGTPTPCKAGEGSIPPASVDVDCVEHTASRHTCRECGQELYRVLTAPANNGEACSGSSTLCEHGDGWPPHGPLDCSAQTPACSVYKSEASCDQWPRCSWTSGIGGANGFCS